MKWNSKSQAQSSSVSSPSLSPRLPPHLQTHRDSVYAHADFRSALTCLARLGQDLDFTCTEQRLSVSTVNSSRTAFGIVHFYPDFFSSYSPRDGQEKFRFSVNAKVTPSLSLSHLAALRPDLT